MSKPESREHKFKRLFPWVDDKYASSKWYNPEEYDAIPLPEDLMLVKQEMIDKYIKPYNLQYIPGFVLKLLVDASKIDGIDRKLIVDKAWSKLELSYYAAKSVGRIKTDTEPMSEETKQKLRSLRVPTYLDRNKQRRMLVNYPYITDSFREDPNKSGSTIVDIKCVKCGGMRTIQSMYVHIRKHCLNCSKLKHGTPKLGSKRNSR